MVKCDIIIMCHIFKECKIIGSFRLYPPKYNYLSWRSMFGSIYPKTAIAVVLCRSKVSKSLKTLGWTLMEWQLNQCGDRKCERGPRDYLLSEGYCTWGYFSNTFLERIFLPENFYYKNQKWGNLKKLILDVVFHKWFPS